MDSKRLIVIVEIYDHNDKAVAMFIHGIGPQATNFTCPATPDAMKTNTYRIHTRVEWIEVDD